MAEINTVIAEASQDLQTIEDFVNLPAGSDVRPRLLPSVNVGTLAGIRDAIFENGGLPATPFKTKALMTASALADGKYAMVTDGGADNGLYVKTAGAWVKSNYDSMSLSKRYTDEQIAIMLAALSGKPQYNNNATDAEVKGNAILRDAGLVGFSGASEESGLLFNTIRGLIAQPSGTGEVLWRAYIGAAVSTANDGFWVSDAKMNSYTYSGVAKGISQKSTEVTNIELDDVLSIPPGTPFVIAFISSDGSKLHIGYSNLDNGNPNGVPIWLSAKGTWDTAPRISGGSLALKYYQSKFQLLYSVGKQSAAVATNIPRVLLPKKIYTYPNLEANIYSDGIVVEGGDNYYHDINCSIGTQMESGWKRLINTSDFGKVHPLSWAVHDKISSELLASKSSSVIVGDVSKGGASNVLVIGDSLVQEGHITQRLLDISTTDNMSISLVGTRGSGSNKHEGRGGWFLDRYATGGTVVDYKLYVELLETLPEINSTEYAINGIVFKVQEIDITDGTGTLTCSKVSGGDVPLSLSGTLVKNNEAAGQESVTLTSIQPLSANPFWHNGRVDFATYLALNSLQTPDYIFISLGVNDTFNYYSDSEVLTIIKGRLIQLDVILAALKRDLPTTKVALMTVPTYSDQNGFRGYGTAQTSWRGNRNARLFNRELILNYDNKESEGVYIVASGSSLDARNNYNTYSEQVNSHNTLEVIKQTGGVHPAQSGYKQIADTLWAFIKSV